MTVTGDDLAEVLEELMSPSDHAVVDIPTFRANPVEMTRRAANARGVSLSAEELSVVSEALTHPLAIGTWNMIDPSQDELEISGLQVAIPAFRYAVTMHATMVLLGLATLAVSLGASIMGSTHLAAAIGVLGLGSFTAVFLVAPLQDLYRSLGSRVQLEIIGLGHQRQMDLFRMYARTGEQSSNFQVDSAVLPRLAVITERTLGLIENLGQPVDPAFEAPGVLPIMMDDPVTPRVPGPDAKVFMEKSAWDKPPLSETAPVAGGLESDRPEPPDAGGTKPWTQKVMIEPKMIVMDKLPVVEAPPPPPAQPPKPVRGDEG